MEDLIKLSLTELIMALDSVDKAITSLENSLDEAKDYYIYNGEVWTVYGFKKIRVEELKNEETGKQLYNEKQLNCIKKDIQNLNKLNNRRNNLIIEKKKREWGEDYFKYEEELVNTIQEEKKNITNKNYKNLNIFINELKSNNPYVNIFLDKIVYEDERPDKKYIVWCNIFNKPELDLFKGNNNNNNIISLECRGYPFSDAELDFIPIIQKPNPIKVIKNVSNNILPEEETNDEIKKIRYYLIDNHYANTINIEGKEFEIVVEKKENTVDYHFYNPELYGRFILELKTPLKEICKQINDIEYIELAIKINTWKRKGESEEAKNHLKYLYEIKGKLRHLVF